MTYLALQAAVAVWGYLALPEWAWEALLECPVAWAASAVAAA